MGSSGVVLVTSPGLKMTRSVTKSPRVAEQCDVRIQSLTRANVYQLVWDVLKYGGTGPEPRALTVMGPRSFSTRS
ncbi:hypothetical protein TNCV_2426341 [Trichonephila clavipes]|nr:hypothetical protein TNCV_2426341 [Trichonephila clavipes]